jgi:transcriptional regulator with XRE-family HTH domain
VSNKTELSKLGNAIRSRRRQIKLSQEALAELANCHRNYIGLLENGNRNPSYIRLKAIAKGLKLKFSELVDRARE